MLGRETHTQDSDLSNIKNPCAVVDNIIRSHIIKTGEIPGAIKIRRTDYADLFLSHNLDYDHGYKKYTYNGIIIEVSDHDVMMAYGKIITVSDEFGINEIGDLINYNGKECSITSSLMRELQSASMMFNCVAPL